MPTTTTWLRGTWPKSPLADPFAELVRTLVLEPAGLTQTFLPPPHDEVTDAWH